ncbi:MAG: methylmalonyl Co-A mutase-associated GTPase MeaB [Alphaproteobacteria bacterium]
MAAPGAATDESGWLDRLLDGDRAALARALTAVESEGSAAAPVLRAIHNRLGNSRVVGVTGAPGAGKSTLVNAYVRELRRRGVKVGVVAVDPSSPLSGGAILGDRIRMSEHSADPGVFVRSLAARGHLGGLSRVASRIVDVMDAAGFPLVVVETVGTGQSEVEIAELADTKIVVTAPGLGDEIQALKAGILEIADILVVNKADLPGAARAAAELEAMLVHRVGWRPPVVSTIALRGGGIAALADAVERHAGAGSDDARRRDPRRRVRHLVASLAAERVRVNLASLDDSAFSELCEAVLKGEVGYDEAAERAVMLLRQLSK